MSEFDALLASFTEKGHAKVHGAIMKCVDKNGKTIYSKISGYDSIAANASSLKEDAVIKLASTTKLIASIALLQCIDKGLIGLDEPLNKIIPELESKDILKAGPDGELTSEPNSTQITARHLLSHKSGLTYWFLNPLLMKWKKTPEGMKFAESQKIAEKNNNPLIFEPGKGWAYGVSLDWAGVVVKRLHNNQNLEDYCVENIWKRVGLEAPYPTFHISKHPEYKERLMTAAERTKEGVLKEFEFWQGNDPEGEEAGGHGLSATVGDWVAVLADLVSDSPKLLKPETRDLMFHPQLEPDSPGMTMLHQLRYAWETVAGPIKDEYVNHGLGGLLTTGGVPEIAQPGGLLCWGGASNVVWFASREKGVAGFFVTQINPFGDAKVKELINAWKKDFWEGLDKSG